MIDRRLSSFGAKKLAGTIIIIKLYKVYEEGTFKYGLRVTLSTGEFECLADH